MSFTPPPNVPILLSQEGTNNLLTYLEDRIVKRIQANPDLFQSKKEDNKLQLLSIKEVSDILRVTEVTVRNLCHEKKLKFVRPGNRNMFIPKENLENYLSKIQNESNE